MTLMTIPSSLATTMYYNIVYEGAAKNLTLPTRAALEWRRSRNGKAVPVLGLVMSCLAQSHRLLVEQAGMLMRISQNSTDCVSLLAGSGAAAPRKG